jgi:hypothetical protein
VDRALLASLIERGASLQKIAEELGVDRSTARRRLQREGLETNRMRAARLGREARANGMRTLVRTCDRHGELPFLKDARGTYRCPRCGGERVAERRRRIKDILVAEAGGACRLCGYDRCVRALEFHHVDRATKEFGVALRGVSRSLDRARSEARKCVLLCSNCHMEVEAGVARLLVQ